MKTKQKKKKNACKNLIKINIINKSNKAITLISLVVTIILLIILAGITINISIGKNGLFSRAKEANSEYKQISAREQLERTLAYALIEKETNKNYNSEDFLDNILRNENMQVIGNNVIVENFNFEIDREKLIICKFIGNAEIKVEKQVQEYLGKNENGKYEANLLIVIESKIEIESITFINPDKTELKVEVNELKVAKDINMEFDEEYIVKIKTKDGKEEIKRLVESSQEDIKNVEDLISFRDKVNKGLTYIGKTINLVQDIDLSNICGENINGETISFEPIGNNSNFGGIFDGKNHTIKNIFINEPSKNSALFVNIVNSEIKNLKLDSGNIKGGAYTGGICATSTSSVIYNCINNVNIEGGSHCTGGIVGYAINTIIENCANISDINGTMRTGGIMGAAEGNCKILKSYNKGKISSKSTGSGDATYMSAGICAGTGCNKGGEFVIENCYNIGDIYGKTHTSGIYTRPAGGGNHKILNCYSAGKLTGNYIYAISGFYDSYRGTPNMILNNNYWLSGCGSSYGRYSSSNVNATPKSESDLKGLAKILGEEYIEDGKNINKEGNIEDNINEDGNIIYINNGYPILKWQVTN